MQKLRKSGHLNSFWSQNSNLLLLVSLTISGIRIWRCFLLSQNQPISRTYCNMLSEFP